MIMERCNLFRGFGVALVTPFTDGGHVDFTALRGLIDSQIAGGADFLCVLGTTAETPCLTAAEKQAIIDFTVETVNGRVPLLLGAGGNCTAAVVDFLHTADLSGIAGVLIVTPYYNKPSQEGLFRHYCVVAGATKLPVVLYNVPGRTGVNMTAQTTLRIAEACPNVVAIKEASGNMTQIEDIIGGASEGFEVISGDDAITFELLAAGAVGVISVVGNAFPEAFGGMVHKMLEADHAAALESHRKFAALYKLMTVDGNPAGIKALLAAQGKIADNLRLPLVSAGSETQRKIREEMKKME